MIELNRVESIQLEISNHCNASCPQCPRNYYGGKTIPTLPLKKWSFQEFKDIIDFTDLDSLKQVYFCGTYGDPLSNSALVKMCSFIREVKPEVQIGIHTNGALSNEKTFRELATIADFIAFGIDGLEDTNHIYRRNVNWQKLMTNVNAFIGNGGMAIWDFIVFDHNQHQVEQAKELSEALGFAKFNIKRTGRFFNRKHEFEKKLTVYNRDGTVDYMIYPPEDKKYLNNDYFQIEKIKKTNGNLKNYSQQTCVSCNSKRIKEIYIGADGFVFPCGWLHDRLYGPEVEGTDDNIKIKKMMKKAGGLSHTNVFNSSLKKVVNGVWFEMIEQSWKGERLERCGIMCGDKINLIGAQNEEITYKK